MRGEGLDLFTIRTLQQLISPCDSIIPPQKRWKVQHLVKRDNNTNTIPVTTIADVNAIMIILEIVNLNLAGFVELDAN